MDYDSKWDDIYRFSAYDVACLMNHLDPQNTSTVQINLRSTDLYKKIKFDEKSLISFLGLNGDIDNYLISREDISSWFEQRGKPCPEIFKPIDQAESYSSLKRRIVDLELELEDAKKKPVYLDSTNQSYCPEVELALDICEAMYVKRTGNNNDGMTSRIDTYLSSNYMLPSDNLNKNLQSLCNTYENKAKKRKGYQIVKN